MTPDARAIAAALAAGPGDDLRLRKGVVQTVQGATCTVQIGGSPVSIPGVIPVGAVTAGQVVWLLQQGPVLLALGAPGGGGGGGAPYIGAIHNGVGQTLTVGSNALSFPQNGGPWGDGVVVTPWSETWADRASYPDRLRLPGDAPSGTYVAEMHMTINEPASQICDLLISAMTNAGTGTGQPCAVERFHTGPVAKVAIRVVRSRPVRMNAGDWFTGTIITAAATGIVSGFYINSYLTARRVSD